MTSVIVHLLIVAAFDNYILREKELLVLPRPAHCQLLRLLSAALPPSASRRPRRPSPRKTEPGNGFRSMKATHMQFGCKLITNTHRQSELPEHPFDGGPGQERELDLVRGGG